jgi:hypothetical protein
LRLEFSSRERKTAPLILGSRSRKRLHIACGDIPEMLCNGCMDIGRQFRLLHQSKGNPDE